MTFSRNLAESRTQTTNRHEQLERRMLQFAAETIRTLQSQRELPHSVVDQLTRSVASIGANYAEACNASSKLDFRNKIYIAKKEAAETRYWIDLCSELSLKSDWVELRNKVQEFLMILQAITSSLKLGSAK